jgi:hypothetical protein
MLSGDAGPVSPHHLPANFEALRKLIEIWLRHRGRNCRCGPGSFSRSAEVSPVSGEHSNRSQKPEEGIASPGKTAESSEKRFRYIVQGIISRDGPGQVSTSVSLVDDGKPVAYAQTSDF